MRRFTILAFLALLSIAAPASAHTGRAPAPGEVWGAWTLDPWVLLGLGTATLLYARGVGRVWGRAGSGHGVTKRQFRLFCAGLATAGLAMISPIHALGGALFSVHMVQHELLILVAAPLLALGAPWVAIAWALPERVVRTFAGLRRTPSIGAAIGAATKPMGAWAVHAIALWAWHLPVLYQATLRSEAAHFAQHASFFGSALLFWTALAHLHRRPADLGVGVLMVFTTMLHSNALGALLTFSGASWYPAYGLTAPAWGFSALEDQQLGGLVMWVPAGTVYLFAGLLVVATWLNVSESRSARVTAVQR
jgi:putative membrane protein